MQFEYTCGWEAGDKDSASNMLFSEASVPNSNNAARSPFQGLSLSFFLSKLQQHCPFSFSRSLSLYLSFSLFISLSEAIPLPLSISGHQKNALVSE